MEPLGEVELILRLCAVGIGGALNDIVILVVLQLKRRGNVHHSLRCINHVGGFILGVGERIESKLVVVADNAVGLADREVDLRNLVVGARKFREFAAVSEGELRQLVVVAIEVAEFGQRVALGRKRGERIVVASHQRNLGGRGEVDALQAGIAFAAQLVEVRVAREEHGAELVVGNVGVLQFSRGNREATARTGDGSNPVARDVHVLQSGELVNREDDARQGVVGAVEVGKLGASVYVERRELVVLAVERAQVGCAGECDAREFVAGANERGELAAAGKFNRCALHGASNGAKVFGSSGIGHGIAVAPVHGYAGTGLVDHQRHRRVNGLCRDHGDSLVLCKCRGNAEHSERKSTEKKSVSFHDKLFEV